MAASFQIRDISGKLVACSDITGTGHCARNGLETSALILRSGCVALYSAIAVLARVACISQADRSGRAWASSARAPRGTSQLSHVAASLATCRAHGDEWPGRRLPGRWQRSSCSGTRVRRCVRSHRRGIELSTARRHLHGAL